VTNTTGCAKCGTTLRSGICPNPACREHGKPALPEGWSALELAEQRARTALESWDDNQSPALYLDRARALAECTRALLAELEAERQFRRQER
jgi:hypothetical protein